MEYHIVCREAPIGHFPNDVTTVFHAMHHGTSGHSFSRVVLITHLNLSTSMFPVSLKLSFKEPCSFSRYMHSCSGEN